MAKIAVLGMGAMGSRMAAVLLQAGHQVTVWNRSPEKTWPLVEAGAMAATSPRAAVAAVDFAISMVRDDGASDYVWLDPEVGALAGLSKHAIAIESSTLTVAWVRQLAQQFHQREIAFLDAPVAGSRPQAEAAKLIYLVGGAHNIVEQATPILMTMGGAVHHVGETGHGAMVKLMVNTLFGVQVATLGELLSMAKNCGLNEAQVADVIAATPVCSPAAKAAAKAMVARKFAPLFPIELVEKDFSYSLALAHASSSQPTIIETAQGVFSQAVEQGYGGDNITGIIQLYLGEVES